MTCSSAASCAFPVPMPPPARMATLRASMRRAPQSKCSSTVLTDARKRTRWDSARLLSYHYMRFLTAGTAVSRCRRPTASRSHCSSARPSTSSAISSRTAPERSWKFVSIASRTANPHCWEMRLLCHGLPLVNAPRPAYLPAWLFVCSVTVCSVCGRALHYNIHTGTA